MLRRVGAVAFAVIALVVALAIRSDGGGSSAPDGRFEPGDDVYEAFDDGAVRILCIEDLRSVCEDSLASIDLEVRIEPVWATVDRLQEGGALDADAWLTVRPFDELVRAGSATFGPSSPVLARSPIALVGPSDAVAALDVACVEPPLLLACAVTELRADIALQDPATSALGVLALAPVAVELGVTTETVDLTAEALAALLAAGRVTQVPFEDALRASDGTVALTIEAELLRHLDGLSFEEQDVYDEADIRYPLDVGSVEVVALPSATFGRAEDLGEVLRSDTVDFSFERAGYVPEGEQSYLVDYALPLADRPTVRTDLAPPSLDLVRVLRGVRR